ncbi:MoaD/ThiS family protein [Brachybacterium sp. Z12]|uniref:MoaD/ThiS family protein n=1 Tax=Brachybacterium sp. Z12 TaxID=2759167 RepID=UPI00186307CC|nr:MoaD/ThiS family protein [Brachybacterium sp. Z12]QNN83041.1 MoaD/ThiS family protein [Brachybacterium sp. Z12]
MTSIDTTTGPGVATAPRITVRLFAGAAAEYGADTADVHAATVQEAVDALLVGASADAARVIERSSILLNAVACTDRSRALTDGDRLDVLPPFAGG